MLVNKIVLFVELARLFKGATAVSTTILNKNQPTRNLPR